MTEFNEISQAMVELDVEKTSNLTKNALSEGRTALDILNQGLLPAMKRIGDLFHEGDFFLPELILSGRAMQAALTHLKPAFQATDSISKGSIAIGTVKDDIHDIGKNLVIMMLEGNGWEVSDLGVDVPPEKFCSFVRENKPDIIGLSALLSTTIPRLKETIDALETEGLRESVKVIVGGALVTQDIADEVGADAYYPDAPYTAALVEKLIHE